MKKSLFSKLNIGIFKDALSTLPWLTSLPFKLVAGSEENLKAKNDSAAWEEEREDILERMNWLCKKVIVSPKELIAEAPGIIGEEYQGEWAIYSCSMLAHALANISVLYPEKAEVCPELIAKLIDIVNTPELRKYDTMQWKEDAMESLSGSKHHMTYLSILSWMITNYKMVGGDERYDDILHSCCEALSRRMQDSKYDLNLLSFPRKPIWITDMLVTIVALKNYSRLYNGRYGDIVDKWLHNAKTIWIHKGTGLLAGMLPGHSYRQKGIIVRGSQCALNCSYLSLVDELFAKEQYEILKKKFTKQSTMFGKTVVGIKEYLRKDPEFSMKAGDAGLVIKGISAAGTEFVLGAATYFEDWNYRYQMLRTAEIGGCTVLEKSSRHYRLGEFALVGEATALAMRTQIKR